MSNYTSLDNLIEENELTNHGSVDEDSNNLFINLHNIDIDKDLPISKDVNTSDAKEYVIKMVEENINNVNKRLFRFPERTSPVYESLINLLNNKDSDNIPTIFNSECIKIASRLLKAEQSVANKYTGINPPKKGSLITAMEILNSELRITIAKIETEEFLDEIDLKLLSGLPANKKTLKAAIINIMSPEDIEVTVTDSNSTIAKYWVDDFLEVDEIIGDEKNTRLAFNEIEKVISKTVKKVSPSDYTELRNNLVGYFKSQSDFHFENMIEYVFGNYQFSNSEISVEEVKCDVRKLSESNKFDTHFKIIPEEIKAKFRKTYQLTDEIEIRTTGHITNLKHVIRSKINNHGDKVLEIKVENDKIYKQFEFRD